jgi:hypothetical protein
VSRFEVRTGAAARLAFERGSGRCLGGVGGNWYRPWLYPLYTPGGQSVLQEFPFDHPFHNACFAGQNPVRYPGGEANFWAVPPQREARDPVFVRVGRMDVDPEIACEAHERGVRFTVKSVWRDEHGEPALDEVRRFDLTLADGATVCDVTSRKIAAYGPLEFPPTKFGGIGVRLDPRLVPGCGGAVLADGGRRGTAGVVHGLASRYVAYESGGEPRFGLAMMGADPALPWFARDYGLVVCNPTWQCALALARGEAWELSVRLVAYDGALEPARAEEWRRAWDARGATSST